MVEIVSLANGVSKDWGLLLTPSQYGTMNPEGPGDNPDNVVENACMI